MVAIGLGSHPATVNDKAEQNWIYSTFGAIGVADVVPGPASQVAIYPAVGISWTTQTTYRYQVQWASQVNANAWFNLGAPVAGAGGNCSLFDNTRSESHRFYRVITLPR